MTISAQATRPASRLDQWYPGRDNLERFLAQKIRFAPDNDVKFIISPHAGLTYCADTQAAVFGKLNLTNYNLIILLGVCHGFYCDGLQQSPFKFWENPLDGSKIEVFDGGFPKVSAKSDNNEHSLELEIPFLSYLMRVQGQPKPILPIYCGSDPTDKDIQTLRQLVQNYKALVLISSDFCHFGPRFGFAPKAEGKTAEETVDSLNMQAVEGIKKSPEEFKKVIEQTGNTVCGRHSIYAGLRVFEKYQAEMVSYTKSGPLKGYGDNSVSYAGIVGK